MNTVQYFAREEIQNFLGLQSLEISERNLMGHCGKQNAGLDELWCDPAELTCMKFP